MGCFNLGTERKGRIEIGASLICTIAQDGRSYLKDSLGNYLRDALGRFLAAPLPSHTAPHRQSSFLYSIDYRSLDYSFAKSWFEHHNPRITPGACSAARCGNFFGSNHDWYYGNGVEFCVRTPNKEGRYASIGVAGSVTGLDRKAVESGSAKGSLYRILPFYTLNGINEHHVFAKTNVVPNDKGTTTVTIPAVSEEDSICTVMLVRYILDNFSDATTAVEYIRDHVALWLPDSLKAMGYETHWIIGDLDKTYVLEIIDNNVVILEHSMMTNFFIDGVTFNEDGTVWTPADVPFHYPSDNGVTDFGSGLERYNYMVEHLSGADSKAGMQALMRDLFYTKTYLSAPVVAEPFWHTEYVGELTVDSPASDFEDVENRYAEYFRLRDRDTPATEVRTWQTCHSTVYDIENCILHVVSQEDPATETMIKL